MGTLLISIFSGLLTLGGMHSAAAQEASCFVHETHSDWDGPTNQWWISYERLEMQPKWSGTDDRPPLSLEKAVRLARNSLASRRVDDPGIVEEVHLEQFRSYKYSNRYYYRVRFGVMAYLNHITCIVLMDGSVLEPLKERTQKGAASEPKADCAEPSAAPNVGPAASLQSSEAGKGPPSVS